MKYAVFDIESENWIRIRALGFFDGKEYFDFFPSYNPKDGRKLVRAFLNHLDQKKYDGFRIYAHNGGKFDFLFLLEELHERKWHLRYIERGGRIVCLYVQTMKGFKFHFADSYALLTGSLKSLGEVFDVAHKKSQFDFEAGKRVRVTKKLLEYLKQDCYCLFEVLTSFFENEWIEKPQLTIASQALHTFRTRFQQGEMYRIELPFEELFRENFYSGGRVEVYKGTGKNLTCFDVNSLYPFAMLQEMPCGMMKHTGKYHKDKIGFYNVTISKVPEFYISPLLVKQDHKNFYVNGKGDYFLSSATLEMLRKDYAVKFEVNYGFVFPDREKLFVDYVHTFYKMKQEHKGDAFYFIAKLMLNSLYGKLGQSRFRESAVSYSEDLKRFRTDDTLTQYGLVFVPNESKSKYVLPYLASYITELARVHHFKIMRENPESIYYCDTDSLYTDSPGSFKKFVGSRIGQLSNEGKFSDCIFLAPKCYALKNGSKEKIRFKGFQTDQFTFSEFKRSLKGGLKLTQSQTRMLSFREAMKRKEGVIESQTAFLKLVIQKKKMEASYDRRQLIASKRFVFDTQPLEREMI